MSDHYCCKRCGQRYDECDCSTRLIIDKPTYNLTDWFPANVTPVRNGWYLTRELVHLSFIRKSVWEETMKFYHNGWWYWNPDPEEDDSASQPHQWRGILK